jgi:hypothetical protein
MSCAKLTRPAATFSGIRIVASRVMNQPSQFSLAPVSWACSLSCRLYSGQSGRTGRAKHTLAEVASSSWTSIKRATSFAVLSARPFPWLTLSGQLVWAGRWMTAMAWGFQTASNSCKICWLFLISLPPDVSRPLSL